MEDTSPQAAWNAAPCKRCGSYHTMLYQNYGTVPRNRVHCKECDRAFSVALREEPFALIPGELLGVLPPYSHGELVAREMMPSISEADVSRAGCWQWITRDRYSEYVAVPDWLYGRRWLLQVNVLRSGYWLVWGSTWTLRGARRRAATFSRWWASILTMPDTVKKYKIPARIADLALAAAAKRCVVVVESLFDGGPARCTKCGSPAYYPEPCDHCGNRQCSSCDGDFQSAEKGRGWCPACLERQRVLEASFHDP